MPHIDSELVSEITKMDDAAERIVAAYVRDNKLLFVCGDGFKFTAPKEWFSSNWDFLEPEFSLLDIRENGSVISFGEFETPSRYIVNSWRFRK